VRPGSTTAAQDRPVARFDHSVQQALARHSGVISRAELLAIGLSPSAVNRRVRSGELRVVLPGVYRPAVVPATPELRVRAVALRLGPACVIAGRWAAWWHGLIQAAAGPVSVVMPPGSWPSTHPTVAVARRTLVPADRTTIRGVPVTGRARTVLDCAGEFDAESIRDTALQRGTTIWSLDRALERYGPGRGAVAARRLVDQARPGGVSPPERDALHALLRAGPHSWTAGLRICMGPAEQYVLDLAIEGLRLAVEVDGWGVHSTAEAYHRDRARQNRLVEAGWTVLRLTPRQLRDDPDGEVAAILRVAAKLAADGVAAGRVKDGCR